MNQTSESTFTTAFLITDTEQAPGGSSDAIPSLTKDADGNPVDAALEIQSKKGALLIPRMSTSEINNLNACDGMLVYDEDNDDFGIRQGGVWASISTGGGDVTGPADSITQNIAIFEDDTGKVISDSGVNIAAIVPPPPFARKASKFSESAIKLEGPSTVIQLSNLGVLKFINGVGLFFVDNSCPITLFESGPSVSTIITGTTAAESGPTTPSCLLEIQSSSGAFVPSRMATSDMNALSATDGMIVYNTDIGQMNIRQNGYWGQLNSKIANIKHVQLATGPYTVQPTDSIIVADSNLSTASIPTIYLPASPVTGETYTIIDGGGTASENNIYINGNGNAINKSVLLTSTFSTPFVPDFYGAAFTPNGQYFYVADSLNSIVLIYKNASSKNPTLLTSIGVASNPIYIAITPNGKYAYISSGSETLSVIQDASTDNPTFLTNISVPGAVSTPMVITPNGNYLYLINSSFNAVYIFQGVSGGSPSLLTQLPTGTNPQHIVVTPDGSHVYITNYTTNDVTVIKDASTVSPTNLITIGVGTRPSFLDVSPDGNYVCVTYSGSCAIIQGASTNSPSILTTLSTGSTTSYATKFTPNGKYVYVSTNTGLTVISFSIPGAPAILKTMPAVASAAQFVAMSPFGTYVYFGNGLPNFLYVIQNAQSDNCDILTELTVDTGPQSVFMSPDGNYCYSLNEGAGNITLIQNASNGVPLQPYLVEEITASGVSEPMVITPNGKYGYAPAPTVNLLYIFQDVDTANPSILGALVISNATYITISPNGQYAYVFDGSTNIYQLEGVSVGSPSILNTYTVPSGYTIPSPSINNIVFTPNGNCLYIANALNPSLIPSFLYYFSNASTPSPTFGSNMTLNPAVGGVVSIAITPDGNYLYATLSNDGSTIFATVSLKGASSGGTVCEGPFYSIGTDSYTNQLRVTPDGSRLYIFSQSTNLVTIIGGASTDTPSSIGTVSVTSPIDLIFTKDGHYAYVARFPGGLTVLQNVSSGSPSILTTFSIGSVSGVTQTSDSYYVMACNFATTNGRASFIQGANTGSPVLQTQIPVGSPTGIVCSPTMDNVFVISDVNNKITVLNSPEEEPAITTDFGSKTLIFDGNIWLSSPGF